MVGTKNQGRRDELLARILRDPARTAILTDVDGTIASITGHPSQAAVPAPAREALSSLRDRFAMVGCVSGRRAVEARELVGVDGIVYSGNHGMEMLEPGTPEPQIDLGLRGHRDAAACFVDELDSSRYEPSGLWVEDKGPIQAFHWRGVESEEDAEAVAREISAEASEAGLEPHWGRKVLEIRPPGSGGKGAAITALLRDRELSLVVYAGDDRTDIDAFQRLREIVAEPTGIADGICVGIASPEGPPELEKASDFVLESPEAWISVLDQLGR